MNRAGLVLFAVCILSVGAIDVTAGEITKEEEEAVLLGAFQQEVPGFAFSRDGRHAIISFTKEGKQYYEVDGKPGKQYEECTRPVFSSDSGHWAYAGKKEGKWWIVTDQAEYGSYDGVGGCTAPCIWMKGVGATIGRALICEFSKDGRRFAFAAIKGEEWIVHLDGKPLGSYQSVGINSLSFDPAGKRFAFWGKQDGKWYLILDGKRLKPASDDLVRDSCVFSPDGQHVLWVVKQGVEEVLLIDEKRVSAGSKVAKPVYSSDGSLWVSAVTRGRVSFVLSNGKEVPAPGVVIHDPVVSPDGKQVAYVAMKGEKVFVVKDSQKGPEFVSMSWLAGEWVFMGGNPPVLRFSPDSRRLAYAAMRAEKENFVIVDDKEYGPYEQIATMGFSPDSERFGFLVTKGEKDSKDWKCAVVVDGSQSPWYEQAVSPVFSEDGKHYVYAIKGEAGCGVVLDGVPGDDKYKDVNSTLFGPTGSLIVAAATAADKAVVLVDGRAGKEWDEVSKIGSDNFDETGTLHYLAVSGGKLFHVTRRIKSGR